MKMSLVEKRLRSHNRPMVSYRELADALNLSVAGLYQRLKDAPEKDYPPMMKAGGQQMAITDNLVEWCRKHESALAAPSRRSE